MTPWLNQHHLEYFRRIAREGGVSAAARKLRLTHSTLSAQLKQLEATLGAPLFTREGRRLVLTPFGEEVLTYAEAIHRVSERLLDFAQSHREPQHRRPLRVSLTSSLPRTVAWRLLEPVLQSPRYGPVELRHRPLAALAGDLSSGRAHLALCDEPVVKAGLRAQLLGASGLTWFGAREFARLRDGFPTSLRQVPFVLPSGALGAQLERWLVEQGLSGVRVAARADDASALRTLGVRGVGVFPVRDALKAEVEDLHGPVALGPVRGVVERYYVVTRAADAADEAVGLIAAHARAGLRRGAAAASA
jgi:LysR family transcriptional activator of nhaA